MQRSAERLEVRKSRVGGTILAAAVVSALLVAPASADVELIKRPGVAVEAQPVPVSTEVLVFLDPGVDANAFAAANGLQVLYGLRSDPNAYVFSAGSVAKATAFADRQAAGVRWSAMNVLGQNVRNFVPDDPYFPADGGGAGQPGQWHLVNQFVFGRDVNVVGAWAAEYTGLGVTIGVVDDSFETAHEDLAPNYMAGDSWDFGQNDADPNPVNANDRHGIAVSGVAAARGGNATGVTGAAPFAGLAGLRIDFANQTTAMFVDATLYHSNGGNTNIKVKNHSYGIGSPYVLSSFTEAESAALSTSASAGTIHVLSAGNDRGTSGQDANKKDFQNNPQAITVAAFGSDGLFANYSNFGANVFVTAPSSDSSGFGITTTDRTGTGGYNGFPGDEDYTNGFGGTSSSAPLVAGVMALVKQAQPNLDVRFAKHLLARTSTVVDASDATLSSDGGWKTNGAGFVFNQNYGFGLIDAAALVQEAVLYQGVTPLETFSSGIQAVDRPIPDNNPIGITETLNITETTPLEEVLVHLEITHSFRGDITVFLTSPMGTSSRLAFQSGSDGGDNIFWDYTSNAFWGEDPFGIWSLTVADVASVDVGNLDAWSLDLRMGTLFVPEPGTGILLLGGLATLLIRRRSVA